ncbi:MAG: hypothetical protein WBD87_02560 [Candidatus Acidiferrales bacterium]
MDDMVLCLRKAIQLDPLSPFIHGVAALAFFSAGQLDEAMRTADRALELQPNYVLGMWARQRAACGLARWDEAIETGERLISLTRHAAIFSGQLAMAYGMSGQREKALAIRRELLLRREAGEYITPLGFLTTDLGLDDVENIHHDLLEYLEEGANGFGGGIVAGPFLAKFSTYPVIADLLRKISWYP